MENFDLLFKLSTADEQQFSQFIKLKREKIISTPKEHARKATEKNKDIINNKRKIIQLSFIVIKT